MIAKANFEPFEPAKVLYEFDGPRIFTYIDRGGDLFLAYWFADTADGSRFLVVPFSNSLLAKLEQGQIDMREALNQPHASLIDASHAGAVQNASRIEFADMPEASLPKPGTMLYRSLERSVAGTHPVSGT